MRPKLLNTYGDTLERVSPKFERFDERDTVFARTRLVKGTRHYEDYYALKPDKKKSDDRTRVLDNLASPGTKRYRPGEAALVEGLFEASDIVARAVEQADSYNTCNIPDGLGMIGGSGERDEHRFKEDSPHELTRFIKEAALFAGADDVGICNLDEAFVYTYRARPTKSFGREVFLDHEFAVVLAFAMRHDFVLTGPEMVSTAETARVYQKTGAACFALASALGRLGIDARAHVDSSYLVVCPPLAQMAGLGEVGRNGILIHHTFGPGVRLGVVTVKARLEADKPGCWGISDFCLTCAKCARNCPAGALPEGDPKINRGVLKWQMIPERCYHYWRTQGTDCGICIRSCPFAKPNNLLHKIVRNEIKRTTLWNKLFLRFDDIFYGKSSGPKKPPLLGIN